MLEIHFPCLYTPTCSVVVDNIYFFMCVVCFNKATHLITTVSFQLCSPSLSLSLLEFLWPVSRQ